MNTINIIGRLTKDAELKYTSAGKAVANFTVAVNRNFKNAAGELEADFFLCQLWEKKAENFSNFTRKGSQIGLTGRLQTRNYENQKGERVYITEIIGENFDLLDSKKDNDTQQQAPRKNLSNNEQSRFDNTKTKQDNYNDFNNTRDPFANGESIDIQDDDLPF